MDTPVPYSSSDVFIALAGGVLITLLAWNLAPDPLDPANTITVLRQPAQGEALHSLPVSTALPAPQQTAPQAPAPHLPKGRSYKCVTEGRVEYTDRACAADAEAAVVNTTPALDGAVRMRK